MHYAPKSLTDNAPTPAEVKSAYRRRFWSAAVGITSFLVPVPGAKAIIAGVWMVHMRNKSPRPEESFSALEFGLRKVPVPALVVAGVAEATLGVATILTGGAAAPLWLLAHFGFHAVLGAMAGGVWKHNDDIITAAHRPANYKGDPKLNVAERLRELGRRIGSDLQP